MTTYIVYSTIDGTATARPVLRWGEATAEQIPIQAQDSTEAAVGVDRVMPSGSASQLFFTYDPATGDITTYSFPEPDPPSVDADRIAAIDRINAELRATDWTQLGDAALAAQDLSDWTAFRAALRALPTDPDFPTSHTWPVAPAAFEEFEP